MIWTEDVIREEMRRLDIITGLHGADLPIVFTRAKRTLGSFHHTDLDPVEFRFSKIWLTNPEFAHAQGLDLIRHEYAHYMDFMRHGDSSHGPKWKACCREIGADPTARYNAEMNEYQLKKERAAEQQAAALTRYTPGCTVTHPTFGAGRIESCSGEGTNRRITIRFGDTVRLLSAGWVMTNCRLADDAALAG